MNEKQKNIAIWCILFFISIFIEAFCLWLAISFGSIVATIFAYPLFIFIVTSFVFFMFTFTLKYEEFEYGDYNITIYAGFADHYLKINGDIKDETKTLSSLTPIELKYKNDDFEIVVTITSGNYLKIRINGELIKL